MICATERGDFPERKGKSVLDVTNVSLALGQAQEAIGLIEEGSRSGALLALARLCQLLQQALETSAARLPPAARYAPITKEEMERAQAGEETGVIAALERMLDLFGKPHTSEYVDGGTSYALAVEVVAEARIALAKARGEPLGWSSVQS